MDVHTLLEKKTVKDSSEIQKSLVDILHDDFQGPENLVESRKFLSLAENYLLKQHPLHAKYPGSERLRQERRLDIRRLIQPEFKSALKRLDDYVQQRLQKVSKGFERTNYDSLGEQLSYLYHFSGEIAQLSYYEVKKNREVSLRKKMGLVRRWYHHKYLAGGILAIGNGLYESERQPENSVPSFTKPLFIGFSLDSASRAARNGFNITYNSKAYCSGKEPLSRQKQCNYKWAKRVFEVSAYTAYFYQYLLDEYIPLLETRKPDIAERINISVSPLPVAHFSRRFGDAAKALYVLHNDETAKDHAIEAYTQFLTVAHWTMRTTGELDRNSQDIFSLVEQDLNVLNNYYAKELFLKDPVSLVQKPY
ncbi:MAG: hypothetical protein ACQESE_03780 [Nanobdellota archaeon]